MEIRISSNKLIEAVEKISKSFDQPFEIDCEEASMQLPARYGKGSIKGINFNNGLGLFLLDFKLKQEMVLHYKSKELYPVKALYCKEGFFTYSFEGHQKKYQVEPLRSSISASSDHHHQYMRFPAGIQITLSILEVDREPFLDKLGCELASIPEPLANVLQDTNAEDPFLYQGDYSLAISEVVGEVHANKSKGLERRAYLESKALELFSLTISQYRDDLDPKIKKLVIRRSDLEKIELAKDTLTLDLTKNITIPELAKQVGLNENKLKRGFKQAYGTTVNQFIITKRLEYARVLLLSNSFTVLEVAEKVGYKNVSYFSRRFKEKYSILPKDFIKQSKLSIRAS